MLIKKGIDLLNGIKNNYSDLKCKDNLTYIYLKNKLGDSKPNVITTFNQEEDELFLNAFRIYSNINTLILFNKDKKCAFHDFYKEKYKNDYILYGIKEIELSKSNVIKAFYQLLYYRHQTNYINDYMNYLNSYIEYFSDFNKFEDNQMIKISILIVVSRNNNINFYNLNEEANHDYLAYVPKNEKEQWICASLFFNQNSLDFLEKQQLHHYLKFDNIDYWNKMNDFLSKIHKYVPVNQRHRTLFYSSTLLYFIGHRPNNDFDFMIFCDEKNDSFHQMLREFELHENNLHKDENSKGIYDFSYINTNDKALKRGYYEDYYDLWAQTYGQTHSTGVRKWEEIYAFGKHHMYYLGIKSTILSQDIIRRQMRNRPRGIADLIALRIRYKMKINIPKPPKTKKVFHKVKDLSLERKAELLRKGGVISDTYGFEEIIVEEPCDQDKFVNTILWALHKRYKIIDYTISQVLIDLGIERNDSVKNTFKIRIQEKEKEKEKEKKIVIKTKDISTGEVTRSIKIKDSKDDKKSNDKIVIKESKENNPSKIVIKMNKK